MPSDDDSFEVSFRVMGTEVLGFKFTVDDFKTKWVLLGLVTTGALVWMADYLSLV